MSNWEDKPVDEWTKDDKKDALRALGKEAWDAWKIFFVINLILTSHVVYEAAAEYAGMGIIQYGFILCATAAIVATVLLIGIFILFMIGLASVAAFMAWRENRSGR